MIPLEIIEHKEERIAIKKRYKSVINDEILNSLFLRAKIHVERTIRIPHIFMEENKRIGNTTTVYPDKRIYKIITYRNAKGWNKSAVKYNRYSKYCVKKKRNF